MKCDRTRNADSVLPAGAAPGPLRAPGHPRGATSWPAPGTAACRPAGPRSSFPGSPAEPGDVLRREPCSSRSRVRSGFPLRARPCTARSPPPPAHPAGEHRVTEQPELEGTHTQQRLQPLALHGTSPGITHHVPESCSVVLVHRGSGKSSAGASPHWLL